MRSISWANIKNGKFSSFPFNKLEASVTATVGVMIKSLSLEKWLLQYQTLALPSDFDLLLLQVLNQDKVLESN